MSEDITGAKTPTPDPAAQIAAPTPNPSSLVELIRQDREERAAKAKENSEIAKYKAELDSVKAELAKFKSDHDDLVLDPTGFMTRRGLTDAERAAVGQATLYDLVPDKAPADHRAKMLEAQLKRRDVLAAQKEKEQAEKSARDAAEAENRAKIAQVTQYADGLESAAKTWDAEKEHPYPVSRAWFSEDPDNYKLSLLHTAANMAESAKAKGEVADLSPKNVAKVFEEHMTAKVSKLPIAKASTVTASNTTEKQVAGFPSAQAAPPAAKTRKLTPDEERIARAAAVVFQE